MRGTEHRRIQAGGIGRITPACAGNRHNDITSQALNWDHPRVCGEQIFLPQIFESLSGSLPRVRGTAGIRFMGESCVRITPACAGNSFPGPVWCKWVKDHPRVCGEQISGAKAAMRVMGSPPRVRGTDWQAFIRSVRRGITPACAGNRIRSRFSRRCLWDHPRVCGEQTFYYKRDQVCYGSPPRVRGTVLDSLPGEQRRGITPACAGNRRITMCVWPPKRDHPRVCGEQENGVKWVSSGKGSPPRVRGTARGKARAQAEHGITPACAGNRSRPACRRCLTRDHPRVCGEQGFGSNFGTCNIGSPPRVRGTGLFLALWMLCWRITPACAGNSMIAGYPGCPA